MPKWKCDECGNTVYANDKPPHCPCGSKQISQTHEGPLEWIMHKIGYRM